MVGHFCLISKHNRSRRLQSMKRYMTKKTEEKIKSLENRISFESTNKRLIYRTFELLTGDT